MKFFRLDLLFATLFVLGLLYLITLLPNIDKSIDILNDAISDIDITDITHSELELIRKSDTNVIIVNAGCAGRAKTAEYLKRILSYNPKVIGIDFYYLKEKQAESDSLLSSVINSSDKFVMASFFEDSSKHTPSLAKANNLVNSIPIFRTPSYNYGFINFQSDKSFRTVRTFIPEFKFKDSVYKSFAVEIAERFRKNSSAYLKTEPGQNVSLKYFGNYDKFITFDYDNIEDMEMDLSVIENKIVLVGFLGCNLLDSLNAYDKFYTPLNSRYIGRSFPDMYGVVIHANIIAGLLKQDKIYDLSGFWNFVLIFIMCYINIAFFIFIKKNFEWLYGGELKLFVIIELMVLLFITVWLFSSFNLKIQAGTLMITLLLAPDISEIFFSTILEKYFYPFKNKILNKLKKRSEK